MELSDYSYGVDGLGVGYKFPDFHTALKFVDEMDDDDWFVMENRDDSLLLEKLRKVFA
jgi:hypothetical protein